ncbi:MAG TPA: Gfo/Idh/MocA family oxidoreductase [Umezawaea sp.]|nr:Gfo/Idh/MocA family oxidoreductase [Umezawaea sp.]
MDRIGVGVIGASVGGWASVSHVPALRSSPDFELRAISTSRRASADAAAREFGVAAAFDDHRDLLAHPGVDVVVVAVKVAHHHELVVDALAAGKVVYSEWPLAVTAEEAEDLVVRADAAGARTVVGLQGRYAPEVVRARELVLGGHIGRVLGTAVVGSGMVWGPEATGATAYWLDRDGGATPLTAAALHAVDVLAATLGEFTSLSANLVVGRDEVSVDGVATPVTAPDQVAVIGTLAGGAAASVFYRGGASRGDNFRWEINGTDGDLVLTADRGNVQTADLTLWAGRGADAVVTPIEVPKTGPEGPARNVAALYANLARDLRDGTRTVPDFRHALERHRLVAAVERSSDTGLRV